jgi:hypothetical protein
LVDAANTPESLAVAVVNCGTCLKIGISAPNHSERFTTELPISPAPAGSATDGEVRSHKCRPAQLPQLTKALAATWLDDAGNLAEGPLSISEPDLMEAIARRCAEIDAARAAEGSHKIGRGPFAKAELAAQDNDRDSPDSFMDCIAVHRVNDGGLPQLFRLSSH